MQQGYRTGKILKYFSALPIWVFIMCFCLTKVSGQTIVFNDKNGVENAYSIEIIRNLSFSEGSVFVNFNKGNSYQSTLSEISKITFSESVIVNGLADEINWKQQLIFFPNPVYDWLSIKLAPLNSFSGRIEIYSIQGKLFLKDDYKDQSGVVQIDVSACPNGLYILMMNDGKDVYFQKFVKK